MFIHLDSRSFKTVLIYLISFVLIYTPTLTHAQTVGGWTVNNVAAQGAKAIVSASQNVMINGKEYIKKGTALVAPTASQVSKVLARGAAGYALSVAVEQLLGGVDWVLDPANNQIVYSEKNKTDGEACNATNKCENEPTLFKCNYVNYSSCNKTYSSPDAAVSAFISELSLDASVTSCDKQKCYLSKKTSFGDSISFTSLTNPAYNPEAEEDKDKKTLPLDAVAAQVISNAESETDSDKKVAAQTATVAAAQDIVNDAEKDDAKAAPLVQQFEDSATTENADAAEQEAANSATGQTKPNTETGGTDLKLEFPAFCGWAPTVCQAAQVVISFPQKLENWYKESTKAISEAWISVKEWAKDEEITDKEEKYDIKEENDAALLGQMQSVQFNSSSYCPADISIPVSFSGLGSSSIQLSYAPFCALATQIRPMVILLAWILAAYIVTGRNMKGGSEA